MSKPNLQLACQHLEKGHVIAYPTEAVWGLGCDPYNKIAVEKILQLKCRSKHKGLILVGANTEQFGQLFTGLSSEQKRTLQVSWPGHTTWLVPDPKKLIPSWIKGDHQSVAVRISAHSVVRELCTQYAGPIVSTSANKAGEPEIRSRLKLEEQFASSIEYIVSGDLGQAQKPSEMRDLLSGQLVR